MTDNNLQVRRIRFYLSIHYREKKVKNAYGDKDIGDLRSRRLPKIFSLPVLLLQMVSNITISKIYDF